MATTWTEGYTKARAEYVRPARTRRPVLAVLGALAGRAAGRWQQTRSTLLALGGFGALDYAAFSFGRPAGLAAVGVTLLVVEYLSR